MNMGTRGCYGFRKDGKDKLTYNHYDSYPSWLGKQVVEFARGTSTERMREIFDSIILVDSDTKATPEQQEECKQFIDEHVSTGRADEWYCLLRNAQGDLTAFRDKGLRYMVDDHLFMQNSLFCEWAYVIDLDREVLEVYRGFQKTAHGGRYQGEADDMGYYGVMQVAEFPLGDIPDVETWGLVD